VQLRVFGISPQGFAVAVRCCTSVPCGQELIRLRVEPTRRGIRITARNKASILRMFFLCEFPLPGFRK